MGRTPIRTLKLWNYSSHKERGYGISHWLTDEVEKDEKQNEKLVKKSEGLKKLAARDIALNYSASTES